MTAATAGAGVVEELVVLAVSPGVGSLGRCRALWRDNNGRCGCVGAPLGATVGDTVAVTRGFSVGVGRGDGE